MPQPKHYTRRQLIEASRLRLVFGVDRKEVRLNIRSAVFVLHPPQEALWFGAYGLMPSATCHLHHPKMEFA